MQYFINIMKVGCCYFFNVCNRKLSSRKTLNSGKEIENSEKYLLEYTDIKKIISRLQDIDKMKNILFDENQRMFFDLIPKPKIENLYDKNLDKRERKSSFGVDNILKSKLKFANKQNLEMKYQTLKENSSLINERIVYFVENSIENKLKCSKATKKRNYLFN